MSTGMLVSFQRVFNFMQASLTLSKVFIQEQGKQNKEHAEELRKLQYDLETERKERKTTVENLEATVDKEKKERETLEATVQKQQTDLEDVKQMLDDYKTRNLNLRQQIMMLQERLKAKHKVTCDQSNEISQLTEENRKLIEQSRHVDTLESERNELTANLKEAILQLQQTKSDPDESLRRVNSQLKDEILK